jgi:hypothetical protein
MVDLTSRLFCVYKFTNMFLFFWIPAASCLWHSWKSQKKCCQQQKSKVKKQQANEQDYKLHVPFTYFFSRLFKQVRKLNFHFVQTITKKKEEDDEEKWRFTLSRLVYTSRRSLSLFRSFVRSLTDGIQEVGDVIFVGVIAVNW